MSSNRRRNFSPTEASSAARGGFSVDRGMNHQDNDLSSPLPQMRSPQASYAPGANTSSFDNYNQMSQWKTSNEAQFVSYEGANLTPQTSLSPRTPEQYQRKSSNEAQFGVYETTTPKPRTGLSPRTSDQYRPYERNQYASAGQISSMAGEYDSQAFQYRSSPGVGISQGHSPQPETGSRMNLPQTSASVSRKALPYPSPAPQEQQIQYPSPPTRELGVQYSSPPTQRNISPYSPPPISATLTPDRSIIGSPIPQMSPNSLQRELEKTKDYSENILTKLIETQKLLNERDMEVARLHELLASQQQYGGGGGGGSSWEIDDLRRKLHEHGQALRAAQDDVTRAQSHAQHQRNQAEWFSHELKETQSRMQQQPQIDPAQAEENRKVIEFYKQKVDQLSRDNMSVNQQNRKLTENLAAAQKKAHRQEF